MEDIEGRPKRLFISTKVDADDVVLNVCDSGMGIDSHSMGRLFDSFYTTKEEGMGIGLSVSKSIIENHKGRLWATPNDGPGTTFSFALNRSRRSDDV
jgi:signal transduction histidine kinase